MFAAFALYIHVMTFSSFYKSCFNRTILPTFHSAYLYYSTHTCRHMLFKHLSRTSFYSPIHLLPMICRKLQHHTFATLHIDTHTPFCCATIHAIHIHTAYQVEQVDIGSDCGDGAQAGQLSIVVVRNCGTASGI